MKTFDEAVDYIIDNDKGLENGKVAFNDEINANKRIQVVLNMFLLLGQLDPKRSIDVSFVLGLLIGLKMNEIEF